MTTIMFQAPGYDWAPGEPRVDLNSRNSIIRWLAWNDRNGCYFDQDAAAEGLEPLTLATAREVLVDAFYNSTGDRVELPAGLSDTNTDPPVAMALEADGYSEEYAGPEWDAEMKLRDPRDVNIGTDAD
jgi:hypothetical protein